MPLYNGRAITATGGMSLAFLCRPKFECARTRVGGLTYSEAIRSERHARQQTNLQFSDGGVDELVNAECESKGKVADMTCDSMSSESNGVTYNDETYERDSFLMSDGHLSADEGCMYSTDDDEDDVETKSVIRRPYARNQNHPRPVPIRKNAIYNCTPSVIGPVWPTVDVCPCCSARDSVGECVVKCSAFAVSPSSKSFCDAESLAVLQQCRGFVISSTFQPKKGRTSSMNELHRE